MHSSAQFAIVIFLVSALMVACSESGSGTGSGDVLTGTGGSTARMTISGDYLYAISGSDVQLFDISKPSTPLPFTRVAVQWDIQTLFPYGDYLLVGSATGLHILDNTDPASPQYVGDFQHARAIDPVVAQDDIAYVTLKRDTSQPDPGIDNQLNVVDISDVTAPQLLEVVPMQGPAGLSVLDDRLYVCDGAAGIKVFDLTNPVLPTVSTTVPGVDCRDLIAYEQQLLAIDDLGLSQYDVSADEPRLISTIDTQPVVYIVGN